MDLSTALDWASRRRNGILITLRSDGRAQSSDIAYAVREGSFVISLTDSRAKTANMRRDDRVVLHVSEPSQWSYVSFDATAQLSPVTTAPGDAASDLLVDYYRSLAGEHDDWDEYRRAMVEDGRLVATVTPNGAVGQINGE